MYYVSSIQPQQYDNKQNKKSNAAALLEHIFKCNFTRFKSVNFLDVRKLRLAKCGNCSLKTFKAKLKLKVNKIFHKIKPVFFLTLSLEAN
jgi:hypothetical protein